MAGIIRRLLESAAPENQFQTLQDELILLHLHTWRPEDNDGFRSGCGYSFAVRSRTERPPACSYQFHIGTAKRPCIESSGQFSGDTAKRKFSQKRRRRRKTAFPSGVHQLRRRFFEPYVFRLANAACEVLPIVVIHWWPSNIGNF